MKLWKRNAIVVAIVLFVCAAVYLNWSYNQDTAAGKTLGEAALVGANSDDSQLSADETATTEDGTAALTDGTGSDTGGEGYFSAARLNRQEARDSARTLLQEAAADEKATQETIDDANLAIQTMAQNTLKEAQIENLITAKGYTDCVAFLSDNSISVVVSAIDGGMTDADAAKIGEIVMEQTGLDAGKIKIIEAN